VKKAALISPLHFLNASHFPLGGSISFLGQDGRLHSYAIARNDRVSADIAIGTLVEPIPAEDGVHFFPVLPVVGPEQVGREVLYVGRSPTGGAFAAGRTAVLRSFGDGNTLDSRGVDPQLAQDRVHGVSGDSGSPSFVDAGGYLGLLGHHFASYNDLHLGYGPARDAVDDHMAASGYLLDVIGEGSLGDPADGGLVVTRLSEQGGIELEASAPDASVARNIRIHDFSGVGAEARLRVSDPAFGIRDPASGAAAPGLSLFLPSDAAGVPFEVTFAAPEGTRVGTLYVDGPGSSLEIPLRGEVIDRGVRPLDLALEPASASGRSGDAGIPGETRIHGLSVTNADAPGQPPAAIQLSTRAPAGWPLVLDPASLQLAPGESGSAELRVTPAPGAPPGSYAFQVQARDALEPAHDASASGSYQVTELIRDETAPTMPTDLGVSGRWRQAQLSWTASRDDVGVAGYAVVRDGRVVGFTDGTGYADGPLERGRSYVYSVWAFDAAGNQSPESAPLEVVDGRAAGDGGGDGDPPAGVCQPTRARENGRFCRDGVDNDCDGAVDAADTGC
ncbi:MAG: NEW3 domain-containing protein, partial [Actinomycetota bacterium]